VDNQFIKIDQCHSNHEQVGSIDSPCQELSKEPKISFLPPRNLNQVPMPENLGCGS
jgi:hypothetical protein